MTDTLAWRLIHSDRSSRYGSGLDDDSIGSVAGELNLPFGEDPALRNLWENGVMFQYPETGFADQDSTELQFFGTFDSWDFVAGLYRFEETGGNNQDTTFFWAFPYGLHINRQDAESRAIYGNVGFQATERLRLSMGARYTEDEKNAWTTVGVESSATRDWDETSWEVAASWQATDSLNLYGTIQNGYQSGQFPARPYCLFGDPDCFVATDNVTAVNYEVGLKGRPTRSLSMSAAIFYTDYSDLPYQVSDNTGGGFNTVNLVVDQTSVGFEGVSLPCSRLRRKAAALDGMPRTHDPFGTARFARLTQPGSAGRLRLQWESAWVPADSFSLHATLGYIEVDVDDPNPVVAAPLTLDIAYHDPDDRWLLGFYGRNVTDEKYDNARLLPTDYVLVILNNDRSEFGLRWMYSFGL